MSKKIRVILLLCLILTLDMPIMAFAADDWQDLYEAYKIDPANPKAEYLLSEKMMEKPPQMLALRIVEFTSPSGEVVPLADEMTVELGGSASHSFNVEFENSSVRAKYDIDVTVKYEKEGNSGSLLWDTRVHCTGANYQYIPSDHTSQWVEFPEQTYTATYNCGLLSWTGSYVTLKTHDRDPNDPKNIPGGLGELKFEIERVKMSGGPVSTIINRSAAETAGETGYPVATAIIFGVAGLVAAAVGTAAGAGSGEAAGGSDTEWKKEQGSTYKMVLYKDFGDRIRMGDPPVFVQARMVEVTAQGVETERPDLTGQIEIFSPDNILNVSAPALTGNAMQASAQLPKQAADSRAAISKAPARPADAVISFRFTGEGGVFQNNVRFKVIGESKIKLASDKFPILATSEGSFELGYELIDFIVEPKVELIYKSDLFELKTGKNKQGQDVIIAKPTEKAANMNFQRFIHRYPCEIVAKNDKETVREKFELHLCYEGIGTAYEDCKNNAPAEEIKLRCFPDSEKNKREKEAFRLPLAVMRWDSAARKLEPDVNAAELLQLEFTARTGSKNLKPSEAVKAVKDAEITAKIDTAATTVKTDKEKKPVLYMIYPNKNVVAGAPEIELLLTISDQSGEFEYLQLDAKLLPQADFKAMITWLIEYGRGTFVDKYIKIGAVATYHGALDFIENRVYTEDNIPYTPKKGDNGKLENHYEDGIADVSRPPYIFLLKDSMPHHIGEFKQIQSLHHELCHVIEQQNNDVGGSNGERHAYFIQHLGEVVKALADMERGSETVKAAVELAIQAYYNVFFDPHNAEPQTFYWFGVTYYTQHNLFDRYANFDLYASDSNLPETQKQLIARTFREMYFPGDLKAKRMVGAQFRETTGRFKDAVWLFKTTTTFLGLMGGISVQHPDYRFTEISKPQWIPGTLKIKAAYDVQSVITGVSDTLTVELDGGSFDPNDYHYPVIDKFTVTWRAADNVGDRILGRPVVVSEAVKV